MSAIWAIPQATTYSVKRRARSVVVWAVQRALNDLGFSLVEDGFFGKLTEQAVKEFQGAAGLADDGVFGPQSSAAMAESIGAKVSQGDLPGGLIASMVAGESGALIGAVNTTVAGGTDCSYVQRRVLEAEYETLAVERAFDARYQFQLLRTSLVSRHDLFLGQPGAKSSERAWRCAVLNHNYPYGAQEVAAGRWPSTRSTTPTSWVQAIGAKFPDGHSIQTPWEWCCHYSLGDSNHHEPGMMVQSVSDWSVA